MRHAFESFLTLWHHGKRASSFWRCLFKTFKDGQFLGISKLDGFLGKRESSFPTSGNFKEVSMWHSALNNVIRITIRLKLGDGRRFLNEKFLLEFFFIEMFHWKRWLTSKTCSSFARPKCAQFNCECLRNLTRPLNSSPSPLLSYRWLNFEFCSRKKN